MKKNYNYTRRKLYLPEYGRHIQEMIDSLQLIEDRRERNRQARAVIAVMGNLNPLLRDTADFTHKLWDHLFIMSDFQLDVDSPYPQPSRQELTITPRRMAYTQGRISYKHYGKYVERMIAGLSEEKDRRTMARTVDNLARYMRTKSYEYNQEHPNNEVIVKDIKRMSGETLQDWFYTAESHNFGTKVGKISGKTSYGKGFNFRPIKKYAKHAARAARIRRFLDRGRRRRRGGLEHVRENPVRRHPVGHRV